MSTVGIEPDTSRFCSSCLVLSVNTFMSEVAHPEAFHLFDNGRITLPLCGFKYLNAIESVILHISYIKGRKNIKRYPQLQGYPCRLGFPPALSLLLGLFFGRHHQREERLAAKEGVQLRRPPTAPSPRRLTGISRFHS